MSSVRKKNDSSRGGIRREETSQENDRKPFEPTIRGKNPKSKKSKYSPGPAKGGGTYGGVKGEEVASQLYGG